VSCEGWIPVSDNTGVILAADVGTSALKVGVYSVDQTLLASASRSYQFNVHDMGMVDIDPSLWWQAFQEVCGELKPYLKAIKVISFSVNTPGLSTMDDDGNPLFPSILHLDGRSRAQALKIRSLVGEDRLLETACNLPVTGGSSLASIMWIRDNHPEIYSRATFGHTNTFMAKQLTGEWSIDPSTTSITGLYNTAANDLTWNQQVLDCTELSSTKLPKLRHSFAPVGTLRKDVAAQLGLPAGCVVLCGGNDAVLATLSTDLVKSGDISTTNGTTDITLVILDKPLRSREFNIRCHVLPGLWVTFFVLNTGSIAFDWFHREFCREMPLDEYYEKYIPQVLDGFFKQPDLDQADAELPSYAPFLQGSRYSLERLTASFSGLSMETTREKMLVGLIKGNTAYTGNHLRDLGKLIRLNNTVHLTGGGARIAGMKAAKQRWQGDFNYEIVEQSSLIGAVKLGQGYLNGEFNKWI
jgi:sugar (pentulose or hexulose) kinase